MAKADKKPQAQNEVRVEVLAQFVGVTVRRIQQLQQEGVIKPIPSTNKRDGARYDFLPCLRNIVAYYRDRADRRKSGDTDELMNIKLLHASTKQKLEEIKLKQLEGELHKVGDIERVMGAILSRLRINLLAIPMGVAPQLREQTDVNVISEKINERISRSLNEVVDIDLDKLMKLDKEEFSDSDS